MQHPYFPTSANLEELLDSLSLSDINELFNDIPDHILLSKKLDIPGPLSEIDIFRRVNKFLENDVSSIHIPTFLGAGIYPHSIPAVIDEILSRGEFLTSYTPYQSEASQGLLQALFEYQSLICELMDMEVANCSLYDGSTSLGEAALLAYRITHRRKFIIPKYLHPGKKQVLRAMLEPFGIRIFETTHNMTDGGVILEQLENCSDGAAGIYVENPSYLGSFESHVEEIQEIADSKGALFVMGIDPISLGIIKSPGAFDADIAIGEGQPLGLGLNYGGPLLGLFTCKKRYLRQMPGRIIGSTVSSSNRRAFCMTLQTREQHIRREKATSNICTNNALCAIAAAVYLSLLGKHGIKKLAELILAKTYYALNQLNKLSSIKAPYFNSAHFREFTLTLNNDQQSISELNRTLLAEQIHGGKNLKKEFPELGETMLFCVTEMHSKEDIDRFIQVLHRSLEQER